MSKKANKTLIGVFVVGAIALLVITITILGSGKLFKKVDSYVLFFESSLKGLNVGAPVLFKGVKIGQVREISVLFDADELAVYTPVIIDVEIDKIRYVTGDRQRTYMPGLIDSGLRAQLQLQTFVTGQLMIAFEFFPDKPVKYVGKVKEFAELPTVPTALEELQKALEDLPIRDIIAKLDDTLTGLDKIINAPEAAEVPGALKGALTEVRVLAGNMNSKIDVMTEDLKKTTETARSTMTQVEKTFALEEGVPGEIAAEFRTTLSAAQEGLTQATKTLGEIEKMTSEDSDIYSILQQTMKEFSSMARSLRSLGDYMQRHPEAFIRGKAAAEGVEK